MTEIGEASQPTLEKKVPEYNTLEKFSDIFYRLSTITSKSRIPGTESERPFSLRAKRAELFKEFRTAHQTDSREEMQSIIHEAHLRDEIARQYLTQGEVVITTENLGSQTVRYTEITPPEEVDKKLPTIYPIPGISNDIDCVGWLVQELVMQGRKVVCVGFPGSFMGKTSEAFVQATERSEGYNSHTQFFKAVFETLIPKDQEAELWGFSTGAPIVAEMLQDPEVQERVGNAVLLCPASSIDHTENSFRFGIKDEVVNFLREMKNLPRYTLTAGVKGPEGAKDAHSDPEQVKLKKRISDVLLRRVRTKMDSWKTSKVKEGGTITVVSGDKDNLTSSSMTFNNEDELRSINPQMRLQRIAEGFHSTALLYPERVLPLIFRAQGRGE